MPKGLNQEIPEFLYRGNVHLLVGRFIRKAQDRFTQQFTQQDPTHSRRKEGEVEVKYVPPEATTTQYNPDSTEDVDFEEIKDK